MEIKNILRLYLGDEYPAELFYDLESLLEKEHADGFDEGFSAGYDEGLNDGSN